MALDVPKTDKEVFLNDYYMRWLKSDELVPRAILKRFKIDVEVVRKQNVLYNK